MEISVGIQWLLQPERYFSQAQRYLRGRSWLTSARQLIMALSSTRTRPVVGVSPEDGGGGFDGVDGARSRTGMGAFGVSSKSVGLGVQVISLQLSVVCFIGRLRRWGHPWRRVWGLVDGDGIEFAVGALHGGFFYVGGGAGAEVVGGLEAGVPGFAVEGHRAFLPLGWAR